MGTKLVFQKATANNKLEISAVRKRVYQNMIADGLNQWDDEYPSDSILFDDIDKGNMYLVLIDDVIAAYVALDECIPDEYGNIAFQYDEPKACVHRLSVNPDNLRMGIASELMHYIHRKAMEIGYKSIVLDTYDENHGAQALYKKLGYTMRGSVKFHHHPNNKFVIMEKALY